MEEHRLSISGVMHLNKDVMKDLLYAGTSSGCVTAIVRSVLFVGADPDEEEDELDRRKPGSRQVQPVADRAIG